MRTPTTKHILQFNLNSGEYRVVMQASDYVVNKLAQYLGIEEHHLIPTISLDKQLIRVELPVPQDKVADLEQIIYNIAEYLKQQNWLKEVVRLSPTKSDASLAQQ